MPRIRLALCQTNPVVGDIEGNVARILAQLEAAEAEGVDLALFPELVVTGYPAEDLLLSESFLAEARAGLEKLAAATGDTAAVVGFPALDGERYNAAAMCARGAIQGIWHKVFLPNYGVFDERRWFVPGSGEGPLYRVAGLRVGMTICEDVWTAGGPLASLADDGGELLVSINASPFRRGVRAERAEMLAERVVETGRPIAYCNLVGGQDELVFDGDSLVVVAPGTVAFEGPAFEESVTVVDLEVATIEGGERAVVEISEQSRAHPREATVQHAAPLGPVEEVYGALVLATRDYVGKNGFGEVVIGLSGGIDSSLVATIAADALGPERVHAVAMPSRFSSEGSVRDAETLAANLGIDLRTIEIEPMHRSFLGALAPAFAGRAPDLAEENLQARIRGTLLMALSNKLGWLVLTTGNKSETAVGFSTLYGDTAGGFAVIRDVPKALVYELARFVNERSGAERIPRAVLDKPPSAELRPDQRDDDSLPPYEVLDPIIEGYVERGLSVADLVAGGHDESAVRRTVGLVDRAEYKRRQAPPGPRITARGFGKDRRMPITSRFRPASGPAVEAR